MRGRHTNRKITPTISNSWHFTTKSGGVWNMGFQEQSPLNVTCYIIRRARLEGQDPHSLGREALLKQAPQPPGAITEPDHLRRAPDALTEGFEPQTPLERLDIPEDGHQPALMQSGNHLAGPGAMAAQAGQDAHFDLVPGRFASGVASLWTKRHHHPIGPKGQGHRRHLGRQWLLRRQMSLSGSLQLRVELLHGPLPSRLDPLPH